MLHSYEISLKSACRFQRRRFLKGFYHISAWRPSWSGDQHHVIKFHFLIPESFHKNLVQNGIVVFEKIRFEFLYVHDLGPRFSNNLGLNNIYSLSYVYTIYTSILYRI